MKHTILLPVILFISIYNAYASNNNFFVIPPSFTQNQTQDISIPLTMNNLSNLDIRSIELNISYDPSVLNATGISLTGTVLENENYLYAFNTDISGIIYAMFASHASHFTGTGLCLNLDFTVIGLSGETSDITISRAIVNNQAVSTSGGILTVAPDTTPTFTGMIPHSINEDTFLSTRLTISDDATHPCDLTLTIISSDETVVPANTISYTCLSGNYTFSITPVADQHGLVTITLVAEDSGGLTASASFDLTVVSVNDPPVISSNTILEMNEDTTSTFSLTATDTESPDCSMDITFVSSNRSLLPEQNISYTCESGVYNISITPLSNQSGNADLTITITDSENLTATQIIALTVLDVNDPPQMGTISDQTTLEDIATSVISFTVADNETAACSMNLIMRSSDPTLVPDEYLLSMCSGNTYSIVATPAMNQYGTADISVTITDGSGLVANTSFTLTVIDVNDSQYMWTNNQAADIVLGQSAFDTSANGLSDSQMELPAAVCMDKHTGKLFVSDRNNHRILRFSSVNAAINGSAAEAVLGQTDFNGNLPNRGGIVAANTLNLPNRLIVDAFGRLWVADMGNHRVLRFDHASSIESGANADAVLGQNTFAGSSSDTTENTFNRPVGVWMDPSGTLWVAEQNNHRILRFDNAASKTNGANADGVLGQMNFGSSSTGMDQNTMNEPHDVFGINDGTIFVADVNNHRVLRFDNAALKTNGANADAVLGQTDFGSNTSAATNCNFNAPLSGMMGHASQLYVSDMNHHRILIFNDPLNIANGASADYVLGQPNFTSASDNNGGISDRTLKYPHWIFFDESNHHLWVPDAHNNRVLRYTMLLKTPPVISQIADDTIDEDTVSTRLSFTVTDINEQVQTITYMSSDTSLVSTMGITFTGNQVSTNGTTYTVTTTATASTVKLNIHPEGDQSGTTTITITVTDTDGMTATQSFTLFVSPVNDTPYVANPITDRIATEGNAYAYTMPSNTFVDIDFGDTLTYTATQSNGSALPEWLSFDPDTGVFSGLPTNTDVGAITITVIATDNSAQSVTENFVLSVNNTNSSPILDHPIADQTATQDVAYFFTFDENTFSDEDVAFGDTISYTAMQSDGSMLPFWLTFDNVTRSFSGTPTNYDVGMYPIKVIAKDTLNQTAIDTFYLTVENVNDAPEISDIYRNVDVISGLTIDENTAVDDLSFSIYDMDVDDTTLTVSLESSNISLVPVSNMSYSCTYGSCIMSLSPVANESGTARITVIVSDPHGLTASNAFDLTVTGVNNPPVLGGISDETIVEDFNLQTSLTVSDSETIDCNNLNFSVVSSDHTLIPNESISYTCQAGTIYLSLTPASNQTGVATITITVSDPEGLTDATSFDVTVSDKNEPPSISPETIETQTTYEDTLFEISYTITDPESNPCHLTITITSSDTVLLPDSNLSYICNADNYTMTFMPTNNMSGDVTISILATDAIGLTDFSSFTLSVIPVNDAPLITQTNDSIIDEESILTKSFTISDIEGDSLTISASSSNTSLISLSNMTFSGTGESRTLTITPTTNESGYATLTVSVFDGNLTSTTSFTLTVNEINDIPLIGEIGDITQFDSTAIESLELTATDIETSTCDLAMNISSSNTTLIPTSNITYTCASNSFYLTLIPINGQTGTSVITMLITDSGGLTATSSFTLNVNLPPELSVIPDIGTTVGAISFTFVEADGDPVSLTVTSSDQSLISDANISINGETGNTIQLATTAEIAQSVSLQLTQERNVHGLARLTVTASSTGGTVSETFHVIVSPPGSGNALSFDGSSNYLDIPYHANLNPSVFTISLWVKAEGGENTYRSPITMRTANYRGLIIYASPANQWQFTLGNGTEWFSIAEAPVVLDQWTHLALTYDGNEMAAYVNGVLQDNITMSYLPQTSSPIRIGAGKSETTADYFWDGQIDELRIYNTPQTQEEIRSVMCQRLDGSETGLVAYYRFDHFSGSILADLSGSNYQGALYQMDNSNWITSGAALGDRSVFDAIGSVASDFSVSLSHSDGDTLTAYGANGLYAGLHVYLVNEAPALDSAPAGFSTLYTDHYFGVFPVGTTPSYTVSYNYSANTGIPTDTGLRLTGRSNNSSEWMDLFASLNQSETILSQTDISAFSGLSITEFIPGVNQMPIIGSISGQTIDEDTMLTNFPVIASDAETDPCSLSIEFHSSNTTLVPVDNISSTCISDSWYMTIAPVANLTGTSDITIILTDTGGLTVSESFTLSVSDVNDAPLLSMISDTTTNEDTAIGSISLTVADIEDAPCNMDIAITSSDTSIIPNENISYVCDSNTYTLSMIPAADQNGVVTISVEITDSGTLTAIRSFDLTITAVNDAPTLANPISDRIAIEGTYYSFTFEDNTFADVDFEDSLTYDARQSNGNALPAWLSFNSATRTFSGTPDNSNVGSISITITATDESGQSATDIFQLTVSNTNSAPVLDTPIADQTSLQDELYSFTFAANTFRDDDAGDSISYTAMQADGSALPFWLSFDDENRTFTGTPSNDDVGMYTITVIAEDTSGLTAEDSFYLTIDNVNDAPVLVTPIADQTILEDVAYSFTVPENTFSDDDPGDTISSYVATLASGSALPSWLTFDGNNRSFSGTPTNNDVGIYTITVIAEDSLHLTATDSFSLTVVNVNDRPEINDIYRNTSNISITGLTIDEDSSVHDITFTINDIDDTNLTVSLTTSNTILIPNSRMNYACTFGNCTMSLTPVANENGTATISVIVSDPEGLTASRGFDLNVTSINDIPVLSAIGPQNIDEGETIQVPFMAEDIESSALFITATSSNQVLISDENLTLTHDDNHYTITVTPHMFQVGQTDITISASDGTDGTATTFTVTVNETHYTISGHISSYTDIAGSDIQNVVMTLSGTYSYSTITDESGYYAFTTVRPGSYTLTASKPDDFTLDLADAIKILKGAVKLINLTCHEQIAADAYIDGYFGAFDASKVAHYVGGLGECLNDDCIFWRFIPEEISSCETWPLIEIEDSRQYIDLKENAYNQDFIGIGCGNVSQ
jgi:hypothetical protein